MPSAAHNQSKFLVGRFCDGVKELQHFWLNTVYDTVYYYYYVCNFISDAEIN